MAELIFVSLPSVTLSKAKSARQGRAYKSRENLHSGTDFIVLDRKLLLNFNRLIKNNFWTLFD